MVRVDEGLIGNNSGISPSAMGNKAQSNREPVGSLIRQVKMKKTALAVFPAVACLAACTAGIHRAATTASPVPTRTPAPAWTIPPTPAERSWIYSDALVNFHDLEILSSNEVWAIGDSATVFHGHPRPIWDEYPFDYPGEFHFAGSEELTAIDFPSPDNGWMASYQWKDTRPVGQIHHWDGRSWTATLPSQAGDPIWFDLEFAHDSLGWAAGCNEHQGDSAAGYPHYPVLMQWNGASWTNIALSGRINQGYCLNALEVVTAADAWAVGEMYREEMAPILLLHWDGIRWQDFPTPSGMHGQWRAISATGPSNVWMVSGSEDRLAHWNGTAWDLTEPPVAARPGDDGPAFRAVLALARDDVWIGGRALFHWDGTSWTDAHYDTDHDYIVDIEASPDGQVWALTRSGGLLRLRNTAQ